MPAENASLGRHENDDVYERADAVERRHLKDGGQRCCSLPHCPTAAESLMIRP